MYADAGVTRPRLWVLHAKTRIEGAGLVDLDAIPFLRVQGATMASNCRFARNLDHVPVVRLDAGMVLPEHAASPHVFRHTPSIWSPGFGSHVRFAPSLLAPQIARYDAKGHRHWLGC